VREDFSSVSWIGKYFSVLRISITLLRLYTQIYDISGDDDEGITDCD